MADDKSKIIGTISILLAVLNGIILIVSVGVSLYMRQGFAGLFQDFGTSLPLMTAILVSTPLIVWLAVTVVLLVAIVAKEFLTPKKIPLYLNLLFVYLAMVYWILFSISMVLPLISIQDKLSP